MLDQARSPERGRKMRRKLAKAALTLTAAAGAIGTSDLASAHVNKRQSAIGGKIHRLLNRNGPSFQEAITDRKGVLRDDIFTIESQPRQVSIPRGLDKQGRKVTKALRIQRGALRIDISDQESLDTIRDRAEALSRSPELFGRQVVVHMGVPVAGLSTEDLGRLQKIGAVITEDHNSKEAVIVGWIPTADPLTPAVGGSLVAVLLMLVGIASRSSRNGNAGGRSQETGGQSDPPSLEELRKNVDQLVNTSSRRQISEIEFITSATNELLQRWTAKEGPPDEWRAGVKDFLEKVARSEDIQDLARKYDQAYPGVSKGSGTRPDFERMAKIAENITAATTVLLAQDWATPPAESDLDALRNLPDMQADLLFLKDHAPELRIDSMRIGDGAPIVFDPPLRPDAEGRLSFGIPVRQPREARSSWWPRPDKWLLRQIARFNRSRRNTDSPDS